MTERKPFFPNKRTQEEVLKPIFSVKFSTSDKLNKAIREFNMRAKDLKQDIRLLKKEAEKGRLRRLLSIIDGGGYDRGMLLTKEIKVESAIRDEKDIRESTKNKCSARLTKRRTELTKEAVETKEKVLEIYKLEKKDKEKSSD